VPYSYLNIHSDYLLYGPSFKTDFRSVTSHSIIFSFQV